MNSVASKTCHKCQSTRPVDEFSKRAASPDGLHLYCRACLVAVNNEAYLIRRGLLVRVPKRAPAEKVCPRCKVSKSLDSFHASKSGAHGRGAWCSPCWGIYAKARYAANPEALESRKATINAWRKANPDKARVISVRYRANHPEKVAEWHARWQADNPERAKAHRSKRVATRKRATVFRFSPEQLEQRMAYFGGRCWMCRGPFENIDHVKPLSKGGVHMLANLRPACAHCNNVKHARWFGPSELHRFIKN